LVVVDEDPKLEQTYSRRPEDIGTLASLLSEDVLSDGSDVRAYGFGNHHPAVPLLRDIQRQMEDVLDGSHQVDEDGNKQPIIVAAERFTLSKEHEDAIFSIEQREVQKRLLMAKPFEEVDHDIAFHWNTVKFLQAAVLGRFFYSKMNGSIFMAYNSAIPPQPNTVILDGTADLNSVYKLSDNVQLVLGKSASYRHVQLHYVEVPPRFKNKMRPNNGGILANASKVRDYLTWFRGFLLAHTAPGEKVLVYCKKDLLKYEIHHDMEDVPPIGPANITNWEGREVHWVNFGRGRGSNKWRDCTTYFRLGDFYQKKAAVLAQMGSVTGRQFSQIELTRLGSGRTKDPAYSEMVRGHIRVTNKQDAARACIRNLDEHGVAPPARLFLLDGDRLTVDAELSRLFPEAPPAVRLDHAGNVIPANNGRKQSGGAKAPSRGAAERVADVLLGLTEGYITYKELAHKADVRAEHLHRTLMSAKPQHVIQSRGLVKVTRKELGLPGRGFALMLR